MSGFQWIELEPPGTEERLKSYLPVDYDCDRVGLDYQDKHLILRMQLPLQGQRALMGAGLTLIYSSGQLVSLQQGQRLPIAELSGLELLSEFGEQALEVYFQVLEDMARRLHRLEAEILAEPDRASLQGAHHLRKDVLQLRRWLLPIRENASTLQCRSECEHLRAFLHRLSTTTQDLLDLLDGYRESAAGLTRLHLASVSSRRSQVMKFLMVVLCLFSPLSFLVAIYGMNFRHMPELELAQGYPLCAVALLSLVFSQACYLKHRGWL
jgi:Mg2+ and Co2+ transporter CorA